MKYLPVTLLCLIAGAAAFGCTSTPEAPTAGLGAHRGAVLSIRPDAVWTASKETLAGLGPVQVDEATRTATARTATGTITVRIEPYDAAGARSILRVAAQSGGEAQPEVEDQVQLAIQKKLLGR